MDTDAVPSNVAVGADVLTGRGRGASETHLQTGHMNTAIGRHALDIPGPALMIGDFAAKIIHLGLRNAGPWELRDGQWRRLVHTWGNEPAVVRREWKMGPRVRARS